MHTTKFQINRAIAEIENLYPSDSLISSYKDFLKHRDYLHFYQYNEAVVVSLINLTFNLWNTKQRISRASLVAITKRYFKKAETKADIPGQTARQIFELYKEIIFHDNLKLSEDTVERTKKAINSMMIGIELKEEELQWLCDHSGHSAFILNRVLRYHQKSGSITEWANKNFEKDFARNRRSEITSWVIDENPDFKIDRETVEYDFEYQIAEDKKLVEAFKEEMEVYRFVEKEVRPLITRKEDSFFGEDGFEYKMKIQEMPVLNKPIRHYGGYLEMNSGYDADIPDFDHNYKDFYDHFDCYYNRLMAWSIAYSRLDINRKINLLSEYYSSKIDFTFFNIGKRLKSVEYFEWLKQMAC